MNAALDIPNLLYRYADLFDAGDFVGAARLFNHSVIIAGDHALKGEDAIVAMWSGMVRLYPDGTPRTRHLTTNPIITVAADGQTAECRSQWTVLQATDSLPLQVVATGRYQDRFGVIDGQWQFLERKYLQIDLSGDLSAHLLVTLPNKDN